MTPVLCNILKELRDRQSKAYEQSRQTSIWAGMWLPRDLYYDGKIGRMEIAVRAIPTVTWFMTGKRG